MTETLESEIEVQHVVNSLHIEVLRIEAVVSLHALAVNKTSLLITTGLDIAVVCNVLHIERKTEIIFAVDLH